MSRVTWSPADDAVAAREGWCLTDVGCDALDIQRLDEQRRFDSDAEAVAHVVWRASTPGPASLTHRRALRLLLSPDNAQRLLAAGLRHVR